MNVNKCVICVAVFGNWNDFNTHHKEVHGMFKTVSPEKTSNKTKAEIVKDMEATKLKPYIVQ